MTSDQEFLRELIEVGTAMRGLQDAYFRVARTKVGWALKNEALAAAKRAEKRFDALIRSRYQPAMNFGNQHKEDSR